jgi:adenylate kinase family enzyme
LRKVLVLGSPGAGKSTFARRLAAAMGLPLIHLDQQYWSAGWVPTPSTAFREKVKALVAEPAWIMDGDYGSTLDIRIPAADAIFYIDQPRWLCMWGVLKRSLGGIGRVRADMAPGCPEKFSWELYVYTWNYHRAKKPQRFAWMAKHPEKSTIFTGRPAVEMYLQRLERSAA